MIVLCPNHHAMMDYGVIAIHPQRLVVMSIHGNLEEDGKALLLVKHPLASEFLEYHLSDIFNKLL